MYTLITKDDVVLYITLDTIILPDNTDKITFTQLPSNTEVTVGGEDINNVNCVLKMTTNDIPVDYTGCKYLFTTDYTINSNYKICTQE